MSTTNEEIAPVADATADAENPDVSADQPPQSNEPGPFALEVDPEQQYKAKELKLCSFARPHMRAFHVSATCSLLASNTFISFTFEMNKFLTHSFF